MTNICSLFTWKKDYAYADFKGNLAQTTDGKIAKISLNIFQRLFRMFGFYYGTHSSVVGKAAAMALFDPDWSSQDKQAILEIAKKTFRVKNQERELLFLTTEKLDGLDSMWAVYQAHFDLSTSNPKTYVFNTPHIKIMLMNRGSKKGTAAITFFRPHKNQNEKQIDAFINVPSIETQENTRLLTRVTDTFLKNVVSSSKMEFQLNRKGSILDTTPEQVDVATPPKFSIDFILLNHSN